MPQDLVVTKLAESYRLQKLGEAGGNSSWVVSSKDGPPYRPIGSVFFKGGKLNSVFKHWGPEDQQKGVDFARAVYAAIASLSKEGKGPCTISVGESQQPGFESRDASISCGERYVRYILIDITRNEQDRLESASVIEVLEKR